MSESTCFSNRWSFRAVYTWSLKEVTMRVSTIVLALSCLLMAYMFVGNRVNAQDDHSPVRRFPSGIGVGTRVNLELTNDTRYIECTIARIDAGWIRCAAPEDPFKPPPEVWYDLAHVVSVTKRNAAR
jgi:hypothetical protein